LPKETTAVERSLPGIEHGHQASRISVNVTQTARRNKLKIAVKVELGIGKNLYQRKEE